jgi:DNA-binding NarL/FixJ family response regulator
MLTKKVVLAAASSMLAATLMFAAVAQPAFATSKVDCDAVMNEVNSGKHAKDIAKDLNISTSSVYRCKRHAKNAAKASMKSQTQASAIAAMASPAAAAPAAMKPAAAASAAPAAAPSK